MDAKIKFIKILDDKAAAYLSDNGFSFVIQTINNNQKLCAFQQSDELMESLRAYYKDDDSLLACYIDDSTLTF